jgi:hypothetical protein
VTVRRLNLSRCPAPVTTDFGVLRCITSDCNDETHVKWRRVTVLAALVWWAKPWWPNAKGRLADRGIRVCKKCGCTDARACDPPCWWVEQFLCSRCVSIVRDMQVWP